MRTGAAAAPALVGARTAAATALDAAGAGATSSEALAWAAALLLSLTLKTDFTVVRSKFANSSFMTLVGDLPSSNYCTHVHTVHTGG